MSTAPSRGSPAPSVTTGSLVNYEDDSEYPSQSVYVLCSVCAFIILQVNPVIGRLLVS